nr:PREDICTED: membrane protein of ER body-like protein [Daucus carota subsp. sativus]
MVIDKEGDCFSLFQIFGNKPEKKSAQKPLEQSSDVSAQAVGNTITNQEYAHAQGGDQNLDRTPNVALPDQIGSAYPQPPLSTSPVDVIIDLGEHVPNVQVDQNVALPDQNGDGTIVGEESGAIPGIIHEPRGEIPTRLTGTGDSKSLEIVKSIVYGGLMEFITSLSIVTSAAASGTTTLNLLTIGLANLISGLIIFGHHLWDLKSDQSEGAFNKYQEKLGKKENFLLHATFAVLSFLVFGLIPPATYGYAFEKMNDKNLTLGAVAIAALLCIIILGSCKAYTMKSDKLSMYIKTIMYYVCIALMGSGVAYGVGDQINKLIENYSRVEKTPGFPLSLPGVSSRNPVSRASY